MFRKIQLETLTLFANLSIFKACLTHPLHECNLRLVDVTVEHFFMLLFH